MARKQATPERLGAFSDGVIAVIITIMVLELKPPDGASLEALLPLWPTLLSYAVSYLFVGIVWVNHHHLLRYSEHATAALIWSNLLFLFTISLIPFATAWMAGTRIAPVPVALYAAVFCLVNLSYMLFERAVLEQPEAEGESEQARELQALRCRSRLRARLTLLVYLAAGFLALHYSLLAFAMLFANTLVYMVPERFAARTQPIAEESGS